MAALELPVPAPAEGTQTLFSPALTGERGCYFLRILAALLEFLGVQAEAAGGRLETFLPSSLQPAQPSAPIPSHGPGAPMSIPAQHLSVPHWGGSILPFCSTLGSKLDLSVNLNIFFPTKAPESL